MLIPALGMTIVLCAVRLTLGQSMQVFSVPAGSRPHDVAPALDGGVWYTAQNSGALGWLDPVLGTTRHIALGRGSRPHGVIVGPDGAPWITDGGLNAIVRVDPVTDEVQSFPLPSNRPNANLNTATFDGRGKLWFTGQNGVYGRLDIQSGQMDVFDAPRGRGPYGIATTPNGDVYYASLAGSFVGQINLETGATTVLNPPTRNQGARRVWSDSKGRVWVSEWNAGQVAVYDPSMSEWREWKLPGRNPQAYAVYVDELDMVWLSDFGANAMVRFDPGSERFDSFPLPSTPSNVRQILGRQGEVWAPESAADKIVVFRFASPPIRGDFNGDRILDATDIDLLTEHVISGGSDLQFDLNSDREIDQGDRQLWVESVYNTYFGDANLDREFNSGDLVMVFQAGQYESTPGGISTWSTGDWNGDRSFTSDDLVLAFQSSFAYETGPRMSAASVPEPSCGILGCLVLWRAVVCGRDHGGSRRRAID
jgi:virginiamycin B lyase